MRRVRLLLEGERLDELSADRGYVGPLTVESDGLRMTVEFYDPVRLRQTLDSAEGRAPDILCAVVLVDTVNRSAIKGALARAFGVSVEAVSLDDES